MTAVARDHSQYDQELINRGIQPRSFWTIRLRPESRDEDAVLRINVIQPDGQIGYRLLSDGPEPTTVRSFLHDLDVEKFIRHSDQRHLVRI